MIYNQLINDVDTQQNRFKAFDIYNVMSKISRKKQDYMKLRDVI